jgi:dihydrofolate synthase/folylpolyglutamate synthase
VLGLLGNPEKQVPVLHIAGTNGKGSTAGMLHALLSRHGASSGLYTSPHLTHVNERISLTGSITNEALFRTLELIESTHAADDLTYFDRLTAAGLPSFRPFRMLARVIECGLGDGWTPQCMTPLVSIITTIGLDHTHVLGSTIEEIAAEKAGISSQESL